VSKFLLSPCLGSWSSKFKSLPAEDVEILTGTPAVKKPVGWPRRRWEDNIRMDLKEIGINTKNWVYSAQDSDCWRGLVNAALNLRVL
jgi:hypothetical protein